MPDSDAQRLPLEILKLILQVALADGDITAEEMEQVLVWARQAELSDEQAASLSESLVGAAPLPPPDLGFLRAHKEEAVQAVQDLIRADLRTASSGVQVIEEIRSLLGV